MTRLDVDELVATILDPGSIEQWHFELPDTAVVAPYRRRGGASPSSRAVRDEVQRVVAMDAKVRRGLRRSRFRQLGLS